MVRTGREEFSEYLCYMEVVLRTADVDAEVPVQH